MMSHYDETKQRALCDLLTALQGAPFGRREKGMKPVPPVSMPVSLNF